MGGNPTDTPRCGVANLHTNDNSDNLLANDILKYYDYGTEHNERNSSVPRHNRPIPYGKG